MKRPASFVVVGVLGLVGACTSFEPSDAPSAAGPDAGADSEGQSPNDGGGSTDGAPSTSSCPGRHGPKMVKLDGFCIDSTEVTVGQYAAFLDAMAARADRGVGDQPAACIWNVTFVPPFWWRATPDEADAGTSAAEIDTMPVTVVDWCDARAFCAWAGKRLCGRVGGGALTHEEAATPTSEWYVACSRNGLRRYPYGETFVADACNDDGSKARQPVGSNPECVGGYDGIFDMSGNAAEWIGACGAGADAGVHDCALAGGVHSFPANAVDCKGMDVQPASSTIPQAGFRCCADVAP